MSQLPFHDICGIRVDQLGELCKSVCENLVPVAYTLNSQKTSIPTYPVAIGLNTDLSICLHTNFVTVSSQDSGVSAHLNRLA